MDQIGQAQEPNKPDKGPDGQAKGPDRPAKQPDGAANQPDGPAKGSNGLAIDGKGEPLPCGPRRQDLRTGKMINMQYLFQYIELKSQKSNALQALKNRSENMYNDTVHAAGVSTASSCDGMSNRKLLNNIHLIYRAIFEGNNLKVCTIS